jgi:hypothetical protein
MVPTPPEPGGDTRPDDPGYLGRTVSLAGEVTNSLPPGSPMAWRRLTYRAVLQAVLRDAVENDTAGLDAEDTANLSRFVRTAAVAAAQASVEHRDDAYDIVLTALLEDWIDNWDPEEDDDEDEDEEDDD